MPTDRVLGPHLGDDNLLRAQHAPPPRTLLDIFHDTASQCPDDAAVDNGAEQLTYEELAEAADQLAADLNAVGVGRGDRVGVRIKSGTTTLYVAILGVLAAGAAYVPVDADDPDDRARLIFGEAGIAAVVGSDLTVALRRPVADSRMPDPPGPGDDAWIIFTSGSTGTPKGVAVTHRSAAAFVDAEARMFLQDQPLGPQDRVMAGLSVAFDASCEEMWLAWAHGAALVPAPRSLVRTGVDVGPWLVANGITVVSTVPTLVTLWPDESLSAVRLLILGGEACPPEIGARLVHPGREVWNTYGPTEATVVSCGARLDRVGSVRIGLPLDGWDLAVVDGREQHVAPGEAGQLVIGGVGLARYLDPDKDAEKFAAMPTLGWDRAYRSGDLVRYDPQGLVFLGRADDQVKLGGRRIELGEIDNALLGVSGVRGAAAAVRGTTAGNTLLVGYLTVDDTFVLGEALEQLRERFPAALVPRLAVVDALPTRTSGKVDRDALPWPLPGTHDVGPERLALEGNEEWIASLWLEVVGAAVTSREDNFFDLGGGSLTAAQIVSRLRTRYPEVTVADLYEHPTVKALAGALERMAAPAQRSRRQVRPTPTKTQVGQLAFMLPLRMVSGLRWLTWLALLNNLSVEWAGLDFLPRISWLWVLLGWAVLIFPVGRMTLSAVGARILLSGVTAGTYPRGGKVHLRLWLAERLAEECGALNLAGSAWLPYYARALGAHVGRSVDLHSAPPVTGMLTLGDGCAIEPEVDLTGHWLDGDVVHIGRITVGADARIGTRSTLGPGAVVGRAAEVAPGSSVQGQLAPGEFWSGSPAERVATARGPWSSQRPSRHAVWAVAYAAAGTTVSLLPVLAVLAAVWVVLSSAHSTAPASDSIGALVATLFGWLPLMVILALLVLALLVALSARVVALGLRPGHFPVHSRSAWQAWVLLRLLDEARAWLYPLYASTVTSAWLRLLGAKIGQNVEASTVLMIPTLTTVNDQAFLADDTLIGSYELGGGWLRVERVKIGKRAFIGNSGMAAAGRKVPKQSLVAVLSAAPRRKQARAGSSWLGSPPRQLRRAVDPGEASRTYEPTRRLRTARAAVELCRLVPVVVSAAIALGVAAVLEVVVDRGGFLLAAAVSGMVLMGAGVAAAAIASTAKWALVGRHRVGEHPLWSSFVWRNELADTFVELVAAPWFARAATGTPALNVWLRSLGTTVGVGVWCESYWLPEPDLVELRDGVTVNAGCVVQTHLFHDRVMSLDRVVLRRGATLGPNSVILPAAVIGRDATVGPVSLVMRGESVPDKTRWIGNPIGPWVDDDQPDITRPDIIRPDTTRPDTTRSA